MYISITFFDLYHLVALLENFNTKIFFESLIMTKAENVKMHNIIYQTIQSGEFLLPPITAATAGFIHLGLPGCIGGAALGTVDIIAIYYKFYDKPYLTSGVVKLPKDDPDLS